MIKLRRPSTTIYNFLSCVISDIRREVAKNCALLGYNAASSGTFLPTFRDNPEDGTDKLFYDLSSSKRTPAKFVWMPYGCLHMFSLSKTTAEVAHRDIA
jgi:hypothetical protein